MQPPSAGEPSGGASGTSAHVISFAWTWAGLAELPVGWVQARSKLPISEDDEDDGEEKDLSMTEQWMSYRARSFRRWVTTEPGALGW
jgi:hypothetical protein